MSAVSKDILSKVDETWIDLCRKRTKSGFYYFYTYMNGGTKKLASHQIKWTNILLDPNERFLNITGFPGCGKTQYIEYLVAWTIGIDPHLTHMIISVSESQASDRLKSIKAMIEYNPLYKSVFPHVHIDRNKANNETELNIWSSMINGKPASYSDWLLYISINGEPRDNTLSGLGIQSAAIQGKRITGWIIGDDIHDADNTNTEERMDKLFRRNVLETISTRATGKKSKLVWINNRWAANDIFGQLSRLINSDGTPLYKNIQINIMDKDGNPTWPEVFPKDRIEQIRDMFGRFKKSDGTLEDSPEFKMKYMNDYAGASSGQIVSSMLRKWPEGYSPREIVSDAHEVYISTDFSHSKNQWSDYSVYTLVARDKEKNFGFYVIDMMRFKESSDSIKVQKLSQFHYHCLTLYGRVDRVLFENNDSQSEREILGSIYPSVSYRVVKTVGSKENRFSLFVNKPLSGRLYVNPDMDEQNKRALEIELVEFPKSKHDDIVDTLSLPFQLKHWTVLNIVTSYYKEIENPFMVRI